MWIRSQDKTFLIDTKVFVTNENKIYGSVDGGENGVGEIGEYVSKERAIAVLDEIHDQLISATQCDIIVNGERITKLAVYQMPKE